MKEELQRLYNLRKDLSVKLENLNKMEFLREGKKWHEKMFNLVTQTREELYKINNKIKFIENLMLEMEANEMFYKKK